MMKASISTGRRRFIIGSAAVSGGVAFGFVSACRPARDGGPQAGGSQSAGTATKKDQPGVELPLYEGKIALTAFVEITNNEITLITPRTEMGQGISSTQAYILAEELDVDPLECRISHGVPNPVYYNSAVSDALAPYPEYDHSEAAEQGRAKGQAVFKKAGLQVTGGSTSIPDVFDRLRSTGAVARETLKQAAAATYGVSVADLRTENGHVILPSGVKVAYTALAGAASKTEAPKEVPLRPPEAWRYIGKKFPRADMVAKCTGTEVYGIDVELDGMLYATVRTHPAWGGKMNGFDAGRAEKMPGVKKIVSLENGAGVIADRTWRAFKAMSTIAFDWGEGPYPKSSDEMWRVLENAEQPEFLEGRLRNDGDVESAVSSDDGTVIEAEFRVPYLAHAPLEPMNAVVRVTDERVDVWTGTQIPGFVQAHVAKMVGLPLEQVFLHNPHMGGSFGRRLEDEYVKQAVAVAMAVKGTPVKMTWTREEDMSHDFPRPMQLGRARGRVKDGRVEAYDLTTIGQSPTRSWLGRIFQAPPKPDVLVMAGAWDQPYEISNYRVTGYAPDELVPVTTHRAPGANTNGFFHDAFLDELLHAAGQDPLRGRLALCHHEPSRKVLEAVGELSIWSGPNIGEKRGRGLAFVLSHGVPVAQVVDVTVTERGIRIDDVFVAVDAGRVIDRTNFDAQLTGGAVWGLGHAMNAELTYENYAPTQTNYHTYECMRIYQTPRIQYVALENNFKLRGMGEPTVSPAAPALANAIFAATGRRIRELPLGKHVDFV